jgi:hypothetical protein
MAIKNYLYAETGCIIYIIIINKKKLHNNLYYTGVTGYHIQSRLYGYNASKDLTQQANLCYNTYTHIDTKTSHLIHFTT